MPGTLRRIYGPLLPEGLASSGEVTATEAERHGLLMAREVIGLADRFLVTSEAAARLARVEAGPGLASRVGVVGFATEILRTAGTAPCRGCAASSQGPGSLQASGSSTRSNSPTSSCAASQPWWRTTQTSCSPSSGLSATSWPATSERLGEALGLDGRLFLTGRVEAEVYLDWLGRAELAVQLRASFSGEASAAVGDCLACGVPMIVTDIGWMGELPDDVAFKVPVDVTAADLAEACARLLDDPATRGALGKAARSYAGAHTFKVAARALLDILGETSAVAG